MEKATSEIKEAMESNPGYRLLITGHSMGGGAAAMLTTMLRERHSDLGDIQCYIFACPACMTIEIAKSCGQYVTSCVYGTDVVPTVSPKAVDLLREEVAQSSWGKAFKHDLRSSTMVKSVEGLYSSASNWTLRQYRNVSSITGRCIGSRSSISNNEAEMEHLLEPKSPSINNELIITKLENNEKIEINCNLELKEDEIESEIEDEEQREKVSTVRGRIWEWSSRMGEMASPATTSLKTWGKSTGNKVLTSLKYLSCSQRRAVTTEPVAAESQTNEVRE